RQFSPRRARNYIEGIPRGVESSEFQSQLPAGMGEQKLQNRGIVVWCEAVPPRRRISENGANGEVRDIVHCADIRGVLFVGSDDESGSPPDPIRSHRTCPGHLLYPALIALGTYRLQQRLCDIEYRSHRTDFCVFTVDYIEHEDFSCDCDG